jgi:RES domain-containing protein
VTVLYRLSSALFPADSGLGAARYGGRWNPIGIEVIYAAQTTSLAALEVLVHYSVLPKDHVLTEIQIPDALEILRWEEDALPTGWKNDVPTSETQNLGELWVREGRSAVLSVPSSIIPKERNFIINPAHPDFQRISFLPPLPFQFDPRLKK